MTREREYKAISEYKYKVTYRADLMCCTFVRIKDEFFIYTNKDENLVKAFASGFCAALNEDFYIE